MFIGRSGFGADVPFTTSQVNNNQLGQIKRKTRAFRIEAANPSLFALTEGATPILPCRSPSISSDTLNVGVTDTLLCSASRWR